MTEIIEAGNAASRRNFFSEEKFQQSYDDSIADPNDFWATQAMEFLTWQQTWSQVSRCNMARGEIEWFLDGKLNASENCIDRHLADKANRTAIIWEGDEPGDSKKISYRDLFEEVCKLANGLKSLGVKKGDRVCIYMPMIPEAAFAMLSCARIGAIHSVVFGGFSPQALEDRILDADCNFVITANEGLRGGKIIPLKQNVDKALENCPNVKSVIVAKRTENDVNWVDGRDFWYQEVTEAQMPSCPPEIMDSEDPLFILYTSGSTGKPKGVQHSTAGYLLHAAITHKYVFDYHDGDIYWCTADVGWITGHSYIVYGPLANGATTLMFEGVPNYPSPSRCWQVIDKHKVNIFYTAPTAIRQLMSEGDKYVNDTNRSSLITLGTVGEPINPEAWDWYFRVVGSGRCPIVDTYWQTETGGIMITPYQELLT